MTLLIITATERETIAAGGIDGTVVVESGIGRTNAACATTEALLEGRYAAVISAGVAGALPGSDLRVGAAIVASACVYAEEGLLTPDGFSDVAAIGFPLGDFPGNVVPVDAALLNALGRTLATGPIATVATCSGTDGQAATIARRTGCLAEAMEGAAVVHAARRRSVPAIEIRTISNLTGDRANQRWDLTGALESLAATLPTAVDMIRSVVPDR